VSKGRAERSWRIEGLNGPAKQPKRARLWLADGSCIRLRPLRKNSAISRVNRGLAGGTGQFRTDLGGAGPLQDLWSSLCGGQQPATGRLADSRLVQWRLRTATCTGEASGRI
jgi:hypothetical protein